jgi:hypothetical protein
MTKPRDAAHDSGSGDEKIDPRSAKNVDLHRYQVMTIPMELQQELASLKGPRLTDEELKPLPPIEEVIKARQGTSSHPSTSRAKLLRGFGKYEYVLLGGLLVLALGWLLVLFGGRGSQGEPRHVNSAPAPQVAKLPLDQQAVVPQSSSPANTSSVATTAQAAGVTDEPVVKVPAVPSHSAPVHATPSHRAASPHGVSAGASTSIQSLSKPQKRAAFKPE